MRTGGRRGPFRGPRRQIDGRIRTGDGEDMATGLTIAVVGVTGAVGQTTLKILDERKFPVRELRAFASERSVGKSVTFRGEEIRVGRVEPAAFKGVEIA